eukprot:scaffold29909_cov154-Skeletonema_menzelii.AAC.2
MQSVFVASRLGSSDCEEVKRIESIVVATLRLHFFTPMFSIHPASGGKEKEGEIFSEGEYRTTKLGVYWMSVVNNG